MNATPATLADLMRQPLPMPLELGSLDEQARLDLMQAHLDRLNDRINTLKQLLFSGDDRTRGR